MEDDIYCLECGELVGQDESEGVYVHVFEEGAGINHELDADHPPVPDIEEDIYMKMDREFEGLA